jgi:DNA-binding beta-propeller fold protein YncE
VIEPVKRSLRLVASLYVLSAGSALAGTAVWVSSGGDVAPRLTKIDAETGEVNARISPGVPVDSFAVDRATGDVWVLLSDGLLSRYSGRGRLRGVNGFNSEMLAPFPVSVDPSTGDVWAASHAQLVRFSAGGERLARHEEASVPLFDSVVDPADRSVWFIDAIDSALVPPRIIHIDAHGELISATPTPIGDDGGFATALAVDPANGSCWASVLLSDRLINVDVEGTIVKFIPLASPGTVAVDPVDGSIWASSRSSEAPFVYKFAADGSEAFAKPGYFNVGTRGIAVDPADGSVWIADDGDFGGAALLDHRNALGELILHVDGAVVNEVGGGGRSVALGPSLETIAAAFEELTATVLALGLETVTEVSLVAHLGTARDAFDSDDHRSTVASLRAFVAEMQALGDPIPVRERRAVIKATRQLANLL